MQTFSRSAAFATVVLLAVGTTSCGKKDRSIKARGSDTLVQVAQAWAEEYGKLGGAKIQVSGGGSGTGFSALLEGTIQIANASREIKAEEAEKIKAKFGKEAVEHVVGYDGIAVYISGENPIESVSLNQLKGIYAEGGHDGTTIANWEDISDEFSGTIERASRQNNSGTYDFFRSRVFGKGVEFLGGARELSGSEEVVTFCANTKGGIGYSGMGYKTDKVNWLKVAEEDGGEAYEPSIENVKAKKYPIARALYLYTVGEPEGDVKAFIDWIKSEAGQAVLASKKFVPIN